MPGVQTIQKLLQDQLIGKKISMVFLSFFSIRFVYVWDVNSRSLQYKLPGHMGSVNEVQFYPDSKEPISESLLPITNSFVVNES